MKNKMGKSNKKERRREGVPSEGKRRKIKRKTKKL